MKHARKEKRGGKGRREWDCDIWGHGPFMIGNNGELLWILLLLVWGWACIQFNHQFVPTIASGPDNSRKNQIKRTNTTPTPILSGPDAASFSCHTPKTHSHCFSPFYWQLRALFRIITHSSLSTSFSQRAHNWPPPSPHSSFLQINNQLYVWTTTASPP